MICSVCSLCKSLIRTGVICEDLCISLPLPLAPFFPLVGASHFFSLSLVVPFLLPFGYFSGGWLPSTVAGCVHVCAYPRGIALLFHGNAN